MRGIIWFSFIIFHSFIVVIDSYDWNWTNVVFIVSLFDYILSQCYNKVFLPFKFNQDPIIFNKKEDAQKGGNGGSVVVQASQLRLSEWWATQSPLDKWQIIRKTIRQLSLSRFKTRPCFAMSATLKDVSRWGNVKCLI